MKVGTDGVLLGTWLPLEGSNHIVDMGTGTGLIALLVAQRSKARIAAIEADMDAAIQASENFASSPWPQQLECIYGDVHVVSHLMAHQFDLAVCNPPFFAGDLVSPDKARTKARHMSEQDDWICWLDSAFRLTTNHGKAAFIVPSEGVEKRICQSEEIGFHTEQVIWVSGSIHKKPKRVLLLFSKQPTQKTEHSIAIETNERGNYTADFKTLIRDFYLEKSSGILKTQGS